MKSNQPLRDGDSSSPQRNSGPREYQQYRKGVRRPRHPDKEVDQRIREFDAERDPLSLPEEIVSEANKAGQRVGIPPERNEHPTAEYCPTAKNAARGVDGIRQNGGHRRLQRHLQTGVDLCHLEASHESQWPDVWRRHVGNPARWIWVSSQSRVSLSLLSGRHLCFAQSDSSFRVADRQPRRGTDSPTERKRTLLRLVADRSDQSTRSDAASVDGSL